MAKIALPYKWRQKVQQSLEEQGIRLKVQAITDIKQGKYADEVLTKKVMEEIRKVSQEHKKSKRRIARWTSIAKRA